MRVHHLNCGTMRPWGGGLVNRAGGLLGAARMVCHCLLVETEQGLVLVDTGLGTRDVTTDRDKLERSWRWLARPVLDAGETAAAQVVRLGHRLEDVRHIVLTHLDRDHAGGLPDFPHAQVHVLDAEYQAMRDNPERDRYLGHQWQHGPRWNPHRGDDGERWFGFEAVRDIPGLPPEILLVPLPGHTRGHTAVAVRTADKWLVHAGDAYFFHGEMAQQPWCTPGLRYFQRQMQVDGPARVRNRARLRELAIAHPDEVEVFCAHDPVELERYRAHDPGELERHRGHDPVDPERYRAHDPVELERHRGQ
ncbi:glyoxylase-like metal-dependent hydrolase (beta-lactamase superfamily II) [Saccharopolyspora erythraea NRRL 2338]|uniref:Metallo-beta-lactamase n=2 Tax=Saccharopolyspora erythraea TaxID=1836 RepID=A4FBZ9_SACEN|nr:MBL fold metallo-hydrolase [Saccharopolyspora erythraea]EQD84094.1 metallo-beta-lactamase [Saccharopolyspora erythraea D]PFG95346.1 glyoxylase-like metal-dependent hydrolase (beta-lactamase superfamily II) [Saccharopolyspora erythraea NRRL 2338]QRK91989.1 MBL fold metallo-hydrolase [Saccharopolyspora erythraea]CAM01574.1 metallo-beta-lactamase [Saccharopolyspora erythraea NRRL 2338]